MPPVCLYPSPPPVLYCSLRIAHIETLYPVQRPSDTAFPQICFFVSNVIIYMLAMLMAYLCSRSSSRSSQSAQCPIEGCGRRLSRKSDLQRHMESKHPESLTYEYGTQSFPNAQVLTFSQSRDVRLSLPRMRLHDKAEVEPHSTRG